MTDQQPESEDSMEEILSSIRQIISADTGDLKGPRPKSDAAKTDGDDDGVLVLTEVVDRDGRVVSLDEAQPGDSPPPPNSADADQPTPAKVERNTMADVNPADSKTAPELVSSDAAKATSRSLSELNEKIAERQAAKEVVEETPMGPGSAKTLDEMVRELMRPMLKDWLDKNLPDVVERVVRKEVQKLVRQADD